MVKPDTLKALFATCKDDVWLGRICRAIGGQNVKLDQGQQMWLDTYDQMEKDKTERRAKEKERQAKYYQQRKVNKETKTND